MARNISAYMCAAVGCLMQLADARASACVPDSALGVGPDAPASAPGGLWDGGQFVYELSPGVAADPARAATFRGACKALLGHTALKCTPRVEAPDTPDYVYVVAGDHDFSPVGRQGGCQLLSVLTWANPMVVAHEIKHALGWAHEQQHPDRDTYIEVLFDDIPTGFRAEFRVRDLGNEGPYDFDSIMHFHPADFAAPGAVAFRPKVRLDDSVLYPGQRDHLSRTDLEEIRAVYGAAPTRPEIASASP